MARQTRGRRPGPQPASGMPGIGVDAYGAGVIDPTENVLAAVDSVKEHITAVLQAGFKRHDDLREADAKLQEIVQRADTKLQEVSREADARLQKLRSDMDSKRIDELASLRQTYETRIADMLRTSVESTSTLVSTQLVQIQNTFNERVSQLEKFRWESGGKTSVSDPALAASLSALSTGMASIQTTFADAMNKMSTSQADAMSKMSTIVNGLSAGALRGEGGSNQAALGRANAQYIGMMVVAVIGLVLTAVVGVAAYFAGKS